jgi:hypothetical protein
MTTLPDTGHAAAARGGRTILVFLLALVILPALSVAQKNKSRSNISRTTAGLAHRTDVLNVNRIQLPLTPVGGIYNSMDNPVGSFWNGWSLNGVQDFIFDQGLCVIGKRNGVVGWLPYLWWSPYSPGPVIGGRPALAARPQDSTRYRAYGITYGDSAASNPDIAQWPADFGAPVDAAGKPRISGDQTVWMAYNGLDTTKRFLGFGYPEQPIGIMPVEIHQTAFAHFGVANDTSLWANTVFLEWSIYNRGSDPLDSVFLSLWTDLDFPEIWADAPGVDTVTQTAYSWDRDDSSFASVGYTLLYGPAVPSPGATAIAFGNTKPDYRNLPLTAFWGIGDDSFRDSSDIGPPYSKGTMWNVVRGLDQRGRSMIDPATHRPTHFPFSGDPITRQGSLYSGYLSGGAGFMMTSGPCTLMPGDSVWMMIAINPSVRLRGVDAINRMRANASYLRSLPYDSLVARKPRRVVPPDVVIPSSYALQQNYPNPFNGMTTIVFDLPVASIARVEIFDVLGRSVKVWTDQAFDAGAHHVQWQPAQASGMYFCRLTAAPLSAPGSRFVATKKMLLMK